VTGFDFAVLTILAASAILGLVRGVTKEILSLVAYVSAFVAAVRWGPVVYEWLSIIEMSLLRMAVSYGAVFIVTLLGVGLLGVALGALIERTGLESADRSLGALFGVLRGVLIVLALVVVAGYTPMPQEPWWKDAVLSHSLVGMLLTIKDWLPPDMAQWLPYPYIAST